MTRRSAPEGTTLMNEDVTSDRDPIELFPELRALYPPPAAPAA